jgi:hypothetical protein
MPLNCRGGVPHLILPHTLGVSRPAFLLPKTCSSDIRTCASRFRAVPHLPHGVHRGEHARHPHSRYRGPDCAHVHHRFRCHYGCAAGAGTRVLQVGEQQQLFIPLPCPPPLSPLARSNSTLERTIDLANVRHLSSNLRACSAQHTCVFAVRRSCLAHWLARCHWRLPGP